MQSKSSSLKIAAASLVGASLFSSAAFAQAIRADVEKSIHPCHDAVFYNNSNRNYNITYDYEYQGSDGSRYSARRNVVAYAGQKTTDYMPGQNVDCSRTRYTVRMTNWQAN